MNKDITSYIKKYSCAIPEDLCNSITQEIANDDWTNHTFYNSVTKSYYSNKSEPEVSYKIVSSDQTLKKIIWNQIEQYVLRDCNFPWWNSWQGFTRIKYNRYYNNSSMTEHCDHIHDMFDGTTKGIPILTVVGLLNNSFVGGNFIMLEDLNIDLKIGDIIIFPSIFLYPHRVDPVTSGTRYSFASWVW